MVIKVKDILPNSILVTACFDVKETTEHGKKL